MGSASDFHYNVPIIGQEDTESCWAAAIEAMVKYSGQKVTQAEIRSATGIKGGIPFNQTLVKEVLGDFGMTLEPLRSYSASQIYHFAVIYGPLWIAIDYGGRFWELSGKGSSPNHFLVLIGGSHSQEEEDESETVRNFELLDPWTRAIVDLEAESLITKMSSLSSKTKIPGHWIGHFAAV